MPKTLQAGLVVNNVAASYELKHMLGEGGMGKVFLAIQRSSKSRPERNGQEVAVKFLVLDPALRHVRSAKEREEKKQELMGRFWTEGRLGFMLDHPHIIPALDHGEDESGRCFLVSRYVEGVRPLSDLCIAAREQHEKENGPSSKVKDSLIPLGMLVTIAWQIASALVYMHENQVAHRDIKPENILFTGSTREDVFVYITDFGIAKDLSDTEPGIKHTQDGTMLGTLTNMAPEQLAPRKDAQGKVWGKGVFNDVYAFGTVLYELMTGQYYLHASEEDTPHLFGERVLREDPVPLSNRVENPDFGIEALIVRCLVKDPWLRPSMAEICVELDKLRRSPSRFPEKPIQVKPKNTRSVNPEAPTVASVPPPSIPRAAKLPSGLGPESSDHPGYRPTLVLSDGPYATSRRRTMFGMAAVAFMLAGGVGLWFKGRSDAALAPASSASSVPVASTPAIASQETKQETGARASNPAPSVAGAAPSIATARARKTASSPPSTGDEAKIYQHAVEAYQGNDCKRAEIMFRRLLEKPAYADLAKAILMRAECLVKLGRKDEAKPLLEAYLGYQGSGRSDLSSAAKSLLSP